MYFDPHVKEKVKEFFNFETLQKELQEALSDRTIPIIAISGLRRTGKTSLIRVVLNSMGKKYIWIDSRNISSREDFSTKLTEEINKLQRIKIEKISLKGVDIKINLSKKGLDYLNKHKITLVVDEAQLLKKFHLDNTIAYFYDNFPNIKIVISGSETGMLMSFIGKNNAKAPLYGRAIFELKTRRLNKDEAHLFLSEGSKQSKLNFSSDEIKTTIENLDGIIGWLTKYGWYRSKFTPNEALRKTIEEGKYIVKDEFLRFAAKSEERYKNIVIALKGGATWAELKKQVFISDKQLYSMIKRLMASGFVEKSDNIYSISDPLLTAAL